QLAILQDRTLDYSGIEPGQFTPARLAALIYRNDVEKIDSPRDLPTAQSRPAVGQQFPLRHPFRNHTGRDLLVSPLRLAAENNRLSHPLVTQNLRLYLRWMNLLARNIDQIRASPDDSITRCYFLQ